MHGTEGCEPDGIIGRTLVIEVVVPAVGFPKVTPGTEKRRRLRGRERWLLWQRMLENGVYENRSALARGEGVSPAAVTQGLRKLAGTLQK